MPVIALWRRTAAELTGTAALVIIVTGSGIMAQRLSTDGAVQLLANSCATAFGLAAVSLSRTTGPARTSGWPRWWPPWD